MRLDSNQTGASNSRLGENHKTGERNTVLQIASSIVQQKRLQARLEINTALEAVLNHYFNYQVKILSQPLAFKPMGILHTCIA